jgi:HlyD family secretion protein
VNGRIAELPVNIGDQAKKGDLLCALDDRDLQTERSSRMTEIEGAKLQLLQSQRLYERSKRLYNDALISQEAFQDSETAYDLSKNSLERAQKALKIVEDKLDKTRIVAPFDCTILTRPVAIGQAVSGSGGFNSGTEIMSIADLREMIITAHLNQADVIQIKPNQQVQVAVEAVPGLKLTGIVERIAPQATIKNNMKGFSTQIRLKHLDERVRPGMTANITIPIASAKDVVAVPLAAVFTEQEQRIAYVQSGELFEPRTIRIGVSDYQNAEVLSGLTNGEVVSLVRPKVEQILPESPTRATEAKPRNESLALLSNAKAAAAITNSPALAR